MANIRDNGRDFFAHESISVAGSATSLTRATYQPTSGIGTGGANFALITVETDQVRVTLDGTTPTGTVGHLTNVGDVIELHGKNNIRNFAAIRVTGTATLKVSYAA